MAVKILYRMQYKPEPFAQSAVKGGPLTMMDIDRNMSSIERNFEIDQANIAEISADLATKSPLYRPVFQGGVTLPLVTDSTYPPNPIEGTIAYDTNIRQIVCYTKGEWSPLNFSSNLANFVRKDGDTMIGPLQGVDATFVDHIYALDPRDTYNVWAETNPNPQLVATVNYVTDEAKVVCKQSLTSGAIDSTIVLADKSENHTKVGIDIPYGDINVFNGTIRGDVDFGLL